MKIKSRKELEKIILKIVKEVLDSSNVKIESKIFQLGIDSIKSMRIISKIKQSLKLELTFKEFFYCNNLNELVTKVYEKSKNEKLKSS